MVLLWVILVQWLNRTSFSGEFIRNSNRTWRCVSKSEFLPVQSEERVVTPRTNNIKKKKTFMYTYKHNPCSAFGDRKHLKFHWPHEIPHRCTSSCRAKVPRSSLTFFIYLFNPKQHFPGKVKTNNTSLSSWGVYIWKLLPKEKIKIKQNS